MIIGAHVMLQSTNDHADMAFLTDVLQLPSINAGHGYMIYGVPPAEMSVHASDTNDVHRLYLMCNDIADFTADMTRHGIVFSTPARQSWGTVTEITLPGGGKLGVYQPRHPRPEPAGKPAASKKPAAKKKAARPVKKVAKKAAKNPAKAAKPTKKKKTAARKKSARR